MIPGPRPSFKLPQEHTARHWKTASREPPHLDCQKRVWQYYIILIYLDLKNLLVSNESVSTFS